MCILLLLSRIFCVNQANLVDSFIYLYGFSTCSINCFVTGVQLLSYVQLFVTPWTVALQAPLSRGFPREEHWSGLPFPSQVIFPTQGLNLCLLHWQVDSLPLSHLGSPVRVDKASDSTRYMENVLCQKLSLSPIHHAFSLSNPRVFAFAVHSNLSLKKKKLSRVQLCDPMDYNLPGSSVHRIFWARILEWVAISFSGRSSQPSIQNHVS